MQPSNGCKLQAPSCSTAAIGPCGRIFLNRGIKFADVQRNTIDHRMAEMGQTRPRRPPPWRAYAPPVLSSKRTHAGRPDRGSFGPIGDIESSTWYERSRQSELAQVDQN